RLDIPDRIDRTFNVNDVLIFEASHHLDNGVGLADVGKELITEALAFRGTADEPGDVDELDGGGDDTLSFVHRLKHGQAAIRNRNDADIRFDGGERVVCGEGRLLSGECVKKGGLANIGQADDSGL